MRETEIIKWVHETSALLPSLLNRKHSLSIRRFWGKGERWSPLGRPDTQATVNIHRDFSENTNFPAANINTLKLYNLICNIKILQLKSCESILKFDVRDLLKRISTLNEEDDLYTAFYTVRLKVVSVSGDEMRSNDTIPLRRKRNVFNIPHRPVSVIEAFPYTKGHQTPNYKRISLQNSWWNNTEWS